VREVFRFYGGEMKKKNVKYPIHKKGKYCGYEEYEDGSIEIAPQYSQRMNSVLREQSAVDALLRSVTEQCHKLLVPIIEEKERFWRMIADDYGLDLNKYNYSLQGNIVTRKDKDTPCRPEK